MFDYIYGNFVKTGEEIEFRGQNEASRFLGIQQSNIWKVLNGERAHAEGYFFEYVKGDERNESD